MTDTPKKTLTLKRKRVIKRSDIPAGKLTKTGSKPPAAKALAKPKKSRSNPSPKKPEISPSEIRARALYDRLNEFEVWRTYKPLAIGIEKAIFKICNDEQIAGASKNVVQKVLSRHTRREAYRVNLAKGGRRYHLDSVEGDLITDQQKEFATQQLNEKSPA